MGHWFSHYLDFIDQKRILLKDCCRVADFFTLAYKNFKSTFFCDHNFIKKIKDTLKPKMKE